MNNSHKNKNYSEEELERLVKGTKKRINANEHVNYTEVLEGTNIPYSTFFKRLKKADSAGNVENGHIHSQKLNPQEEEVLKNYMIERIDMGINTTKADLIRAARCLGKSRSPDFTVGDKWYQLFMKRSKILEYNNEADPDISKIKSTNYDVLKDWTNRYNRVIVDGKIKECNIYNMNTVNVRIVQTSRYRVFKVRQNGQKNLCRLAGTRYVTVVETISMSGTKLTPKIIFPEKTSLLNWYNKDEFVDFVYDILDEGWMTKELACDWLEEIFIPESGAGVGKDPVLLIMDDHSAHKTPEFMKICDENNVEVLYIPPNTSYLTQPLDQCRFGSPDNIFKQIIDEKLKTENLNKETFGQIYSIAREDSLTEGIIKQTWKKVGLLDQNYDILLENVNVIGRPQSSKESTPETEESNSDYPGLITSPKTEEDRAMVKKNISTSDDVAQEQLELIRKSYERHTAVEAMLQFKLDEITKEKEQMEHFLDQTQKQIVPGSLPFQQNNENKGEFGEEKMSYVEKMLQATLRYNK